MGYHGWQSRTKYVAGTPDYSGSLYNPITGRTYQLNYNGQEFRSIPMKQLVGAPAGTKRFKGREDIYVKPAGAAYNSDSYDEEYNENTNIAFYRNPYEGRHSETDIRHSNKFGTTMHNDLSGNKYHGPAGRRTDVMTPGIKGTVDISNQAEQGFLPISAAMYERPSYEMVNLEKYKNPELKGHYDKSDIAKVDSDILVLSAAVKDMHDTLNRAQKADPNMLEQAKPLIDSFKEAQDYAMRQGFKLDQFSVNDRLDKFGYKDSSSKMGALVNLAQKRVETYLKSQLDREQYVANTKSQYEDDIRKNIQSAHQTYNMMDDNRKTMMNAMNIVDEQEARNTFNINNQMLDKADRRNKLLQHDADKNVETDLQNQKLNMMRGEIFNKIESDAYDKLLKAKMGYDAGKKEGHSITYKGWGNRIGKEFEQIGKELLREGGKALMGAVL